MQELHSRKRFFNWKCNSRMEKKADMYQSIITIRSLICLPPFASAAKRMQKKLPVVDRPLNGIESACILLIASSFPALKLYARKTKPVARNRSHHCSEKDTRAQNGGSARETAEITKSEREKRNTCRRAIFAKRRFYVACRGSESE